MLAQLDDGIGAIAASGDSGDRRPLCHGSVIYHGNSYRLISLSRRDL